MNLPIVGELQREPYTPGPVDELGLRPDGWGPASTVPTHGWWEPGADELAASAGRRAVESDLVALVPAGTVTGDRDRWTVAGDTYLQQGGPQDNNHGPFGMRVPLAIYLKRTEG